VRQPGCARGPVILLGAGTLAKPIIFLVDDDPDVLQSITRDLRREFGEQFRILNASSGPEALEALGVLKLRNDPVALFVVDQRMPRMTGVEFLERALEMFPDCKRVLLTAYADIDAAIRAINVVGIDYYLNKPWDPPEEILYPPLHDLLDDWLAAYRPPFEGVRVIGHRWSPACYDIKRFLSLNQVPYQWLDIEAEGEALTLIEQAGLDAGTLPVLFFPDGSWLSASDTGAITERLGLRTEPERPFYDLVIVGAGPAGLGAAVYGASEGLHTLIIEKAAPGGQAVESSRIENYLGFPVGLSGADLTRRAVAQARRFGAEILSPQEVVRIRLEDPYRVVVLADGREVSCTALLIATGVEYCRLDVPGIDALTGAGVYYGATMSEAPAFKGQDIFIVGAGNSAGQAAMHYSKYAGNITLLVRGPDPGRSMSRYLVDQLKTRDNITVRVRSQIVEAYGDGHLESVMLADLERDVRERVRADAVFIFIGARPQTQWLRDMVECDEYGFLLCGPYLPRDSRGRPHHWPLDRDPFIFETNVPGVFVVGDVRHGSVKRVATAVGEGAMVIQMVHQYLEGL
jgi:thioredoxin reductase (NADPH)